MRLTCLSALFVSIWRWFQINLFCVFLTILFIPLSTNAAEFPWPMFLPGITSSTLCNYENLERCRSESNCLNYGGYWFNKECNANVSCSDIAGCYEGNFSDNCPGYNLGGDAGMTIAANCSFTSISQYGVKSSGTISFRQGISFSGSGQTDSNGCGQYSISGSFTGNTVSCNYQYSNGRSGSISNASMQNCQQPNRFLTETLGGYWTFRYTILSEWVDYYYLDSNSISEYPSGSNEYSIYGENQYGDLVIAGYDPAYGDYSLFDSGSIIDQLFIFNYTNANSVAGCYYQYSHSYGSWSDCYPMNGIRTSSRQPLDSDNTDYRYDTSEKRLSAKEAEVTSLSKNKLTDEDVIERLSSMRNKYLSTSLK